MKMSDFDNFGKAVADNEDRELDLNAELVSDEVEFLVAPEGDFPFLVKDIKHTRHNGTNRDGTPSKTPPCDMMVAELDVQIGEGKIASARHNFYLLQSRAGSIGAFFVAIGLKKKGQPYKMHWEDAIGKTGYVHMGPPREYKGSQYSNVKYFIDPEKKDTKTTADSKWDKGTF